MGALKQIVLLALLAFVPAASAHAQQYGALEFPRDEHEHVDGWNFWWGAADLTTESGNRYTVGVAFDSLYGVGLTGHQVLPQQGPYADRAINTMDGPEEWGHGAQAHGRFVTKMSNHVPGTRTPLVGTTRDLFDGGKEIGRWERTTMERESYRLKLDNDEARVHPTGENVSLDVELDADMHSPPLLAGGTGTWWYGIPENHDYPSRSYHYVQAAKHLTGTLELEQPDGSILREKVVPEASTMIMVREYDASPEDLFAGLGRAQATQMHPRYASYYEGGMPWELVFLDLKNGAQLMVAVMAFHETKKGTATPVVGQGQPTYQVLSTLRLPTGESVPLNDKLRVEHLDYRQSIGRVPTFWVAVKGIWQQAWRYRMSYPGGTEELPNGETVDVPAFDLGVVPQLDEPAVDDRGNGNTQRFAYLADGNYGGCPVHGFGWSELIIQWRGREEQDPWRTDGGLPEVPAECGPPPTPPVGQPGDMEPDPGEAPPPSIAPDPGCSAGLGTPRCEYIATTPVGLAGYGAEPGGWTATISPADGGEPIVIKSQGGNELYACGTARPGDRIVVEAEEGSNVSIGNPGICF
ncbi:MAG TPA: hypothetical protein VD790_12100 [Thermoleophilaceae bacterium]|nr:hypothetical protein [Thermoleophilaceae bacterium]